MKRKINGLFEKIPIAGYVLSAFVKYFAGAVIGFAAVFAVLKITGVYDKLEGMLNIKYDSPFIMIPLIVFLALGVLSFFMGILFYFYKYRRPKGYKNGFNENLTNILNHNVKQ